MRIVLGVLAADAGEGRWAGAPLTFEARRRIGHMPEERGLYPKVRLAEQLAAAGLDPASVVAEVAGAGPGAEPSATQPAAQPGDPGGLRRRVHLHVLAQLLRCLRGPGGGRGKGNPDRRDRAGHGPPRPAACRQIIGIGLVGLFQLAIIGATAFVLISLTHVVPVPAVGAGAIAVHLAWSLLGFYLHAGMFASGAALVSRQEEIASVTAPPILLLSCLLVNVVMLDPGSMTITVLSLLPPFAPVLMTARLAAGDPPAWQVLPAAALTFATAGC